MMKYSTLLKVFGFILILPVAVFLILGIFASGVIPNLTTNLHFKVFCGFVLLVMGVGFILGGQLNEDWAD